MKRAIIIGIVVVAVVAVAVVASLSPPRVVQAGVARRGLMRSFVEERARTRLPQTYRITMPSDGRILAINLQEGDRVTAGQAVAQMAPQDLQLAVDVGTARVAALAAQVVKEEDNRLEQTALAAMNKEVEAMKELVAAAEEQTKATRARLDLATWDVERYERLLGDQAASEKELRDARFAKNDAAINDKTAALVLRAMKALQIVWEMGPKMIAQYIEKKTLTGAVLEHDQAAAAAELAQLELNRQRGTLTSPVDGVVLRREVSNERVLPAGTLLLEIGRIEDLEVEVEVLTQDAVQVRPGQPVDISGPAIGTEPARGKVARMYPEGFTKISSLGVEQQRVRVVVSFDEGELARLEQAGHALGSGYRVRVRIYTAEEPDAVIVPRSALFRGAGGAWQVFVVRGGRAELTEVVLGLANDEEVAVTSGVQPEEQVVLAPPASLETGTKVAPQVLARDGA